MQWALLEHAILYVIFTLEVVTQDHGDIIYGGLDMRPRLNMAINLARFHAAPQDTQKRLRSLRDKIRKQKLAERRNTAIHGVHKATDNKAEFILTMPRMADPLKNTVLSYRDLHSLGHEINEASTEAFAIMHEIGEWKMGKHSLDDRADSIGVGEPISGIGVAQGFYSRIESFFRNING